MMQRGEMRAWDIAEAVKTGAKDVEQTEMKKIGGGLKSGTQDNTGDPALGTAHQWPVTES